MGPSLFSDGNRSLHRGTPTARGCFNGAVAIQRRKYTAQRTSAIEGLSFNGAVAIQRRKSRA